MPTISPAQSIEAIRNGPAATPPPGIVPSYDDPSNDNKLAIITIALSIAFTTVAVLIRIYSKVFCVRRARIEDYLGFASFPFFIAGTWVLTKVPDKPGYFIHLWNLRVYNLEDFLSAYILSTTLYCVTLLLIKAAILLEWSHIFVPRPNRNGFWWICYGMLIANTALYLATIAALNYACLPRQKIWRPYLPGVCISFNAFNIFITIFHLIFDLAMLLLPHTVIWKLGLTTRQKIAVSVIFSVGIIACAWAAGRVVSAFTLTASQDKTYAYSQYIMWGIAEVTTAELIFCVPAFPLAFRPPSPLHTFCHILQSKVTMILYPERLSSTSTLPHSTAKSDSRGLHNYRPTWLDDSSETGLTELTPVRIHGGPPVESSHNPTITLGGILVTTEIDVCTDTGKSLKSIPCGRETSRSEW
ncbi:hypothetical protein GGR57DRAFT_456574 [Xylariaceae sp. FL1272]|nr:hypothetical protein GGR57DRAFT_456574 [Xylariaceae sp. FL1272]